MKIFEKAADLPSEWDELCADNYAMKRHTLSILEQGNPCHQKYIVFFNQADRISSILVTYQLPNQNICCFTPLTFRVKTTLVHVPFSVTRNGFVLNDDTIAEVQSYLKSIKGYLIVLNTPEDFNLEGFARGRTSWQLRMELIWPDFKSYIGAMRSNYRHRYNKAIKKGSDLKFRFLSDNSEFSDKHYKLYENVYNSSRLCLEKLNQSYFQSDIGRIMLAEADGQAVGFVQLIDNRPELIFAFVGLDYTFNHKYDTYINLLLELIRYALDNKYTRLEFGQTAEDAKLKLGGEYNPICFLMRHSNPLVNCFVPFTTKLVQYKPYKNSFNVFK